jgi:hypothetical protein
MARGGTGYGYPRPYNETDSGELPDVTGPTGIYMGGWPEINRMHLAQTGPFSGDTPNSRSGRAMMGGPAPGEPNPANMGRDD